MTEKYEKGQEGENIAAEFLSRKGYHILEKNYRAGQLELDLITRHKECLVFVEVRLRKNADYGYPETSMSKAKISAVKRAAQVYLNKTFWTGDIRFDMIAIVEKPTLEIEHFEDAYF